MLSLPVNAVKDRLHSLWNEAGGLLLVAPPGTGKSTAVPVMGLAESGRVVCLEPRRVAVRSLANYVAAGLAEPVGETVGYRMRLEQAVSSRTRIEYVTYGVFWRQLQEHGGWPEDLDLLLLDEFHERSLEMNLVCGWIARERQAGRPVPRFGLLSATIDPDVVRRVLPDLPVVEVTAPAWPVEVRHWPRPSRFDPRRLVERVATGVLQLARELPEGDILAFVPGYREIRQVIALLERDLRGWKVLPLSGEQTGEQQAAAIRGGQSRRVIVATNIAETSVTVEGLRAVVDGGLVRRMEYDPGCGVNALRTVRVSLYSARQRAGRAGRQAPGCCLRVWSAEEEAELEQQSAAEILGLDLAETALTLQFMGLTGVESFPWIDPPASSRWQEARTLLRRLGAIDAAGRLSDWGRQLAAMPVHPRLGACFLRAVQLGVGESAAVLIGLLQEEGVLRRDSRSREVFWRKEDQADFEAELRAWDYWRSEGPEAARKSGISIFGSQAVRQNAGRLRPFAGAPMPATAGDPCEPTAGMRRALLAGFSDRVGKVETRGLGTARLCNGQPVRFSQDGMVRPQEWFLALRLREVMIDGSRVVLAENVVALDAVWIAQDMAAQIEEVSSVGYDSEAGVVSALWEQRYGVLTLEVRREEVTDPGARAAAWATLVQEGQVTMSGWNEEVEQLLARHALLVRHFPELAVEPFDELARHLVVEAVAGGVRSLRELKRAPVLPALKEFIGREVVGLLEHYFPGTIELPGRRKPVRVDYCAAGGPRISSRLQDFYDLPQHPAVGDGRVPLMVELLAPNQRPVQVTTDLPAFWAGSYASVKKELKGRYPKHDWR